MHSGTLLLLIEMYPTLIDCTKFLKVNFMGKRRYGLRTRYQILRFTVQILVQPYSHTLFAIGKNSQRMR